VKKTKQPGDNISLKTKKTEDPSVMNWINAQTNLMDSLRYLIEHEIVQNGVRNLQTFIPMERNVLGALTVPSIQEKVMNEPPPQALPELAVVQSGIREVTEGLKEVSAAKPDLREKPELASQAAAAEQPLLEPKQAEDDIADEDIEAWV
jgi:hypothetical protein